VAQGVVQGIAFLLFIPPLYVLFRCAQARSPQVRGPLVAFVFIGPVLFAVSNLVLSLGLKDVSQRFADQLPAKQQHARQHAEAAAKGGGGSGGKVKGAQSKGTATNTAKSGTQPSGTVTQATGTATHSTGTGTSTSATSTIQTPDQAASSARDNLAKDLIDNSS